MLFSFLFAILLSLLSVTVSLPNAKPNQSPTLSAAQLDALIPSYLRPSPTTANSTATDGSTCTRSYWKGSWAFSVTIRNKTTPETSALGTGLYDNVNGDCKGLHWPSNPIPLTEVGGRVTSYSVWLEVETENPYDGCVEQAIKQAEDKDVICTVVPSPCRPNASECSV